ncbi:MAG TPA: NADP-dependent oxidoreductase [Micromonospora sp.]
MGVARSSCVVLAAVPHGVPSPDCFALREEQVPQLRDGDVLVHVTELSLDPYLRTAIVGRHLDDPVVPIGGVIPGRAIGRVVESRSPSVEEGTWVLAETGWREYAVLPGSEVQPVQVPPGVPRSAALGALGMPGLTAYAAIERHLRPTAGETVVIGSAVGGVGSVAGQLARVAGARTVALVGDERKARIARDRLGYDEVVIRTAPDWRDQLARACPEGVHGYLHMGDAPTLDGVLNALAIGARVSLCGLMDQYNDGPRTMLAAGAVMRARAIVYGMVVYDHADLADQHRARVGELIRTGQLTLNEDRYSGLDRAPEAFSRLMSGQNTGKVVVEVVPSDEVGDR